MVIASNKVLDRAVPEVGIGEFLIGLLMFVPPTAFGYAFIIGPAFKLFSRKDWHFVPLIMALLLVGCVGGLTIAWLTAFALTGRVAPPSFDERGIFVGSYLFGAGCGFYATVVWLAMNHRLIKRRA